MLGHSGRSSPEQKQRTTTPGPTARRLQKKQRKLIAAILAQFPAQERELLEIVLKNQPLSGQLKKLEAWVATPKREQMVCLLKDIAKKAKWRANDLNEDEAWNLLTLEHIAEIMALDPTSELLEDAKTIIAQAVLSGSGQHRDGSTRQVAKRMRRIQLHS